MITKAAQTGIPAWGLASSFTDKLLNPVENSNQTARLQCNFGANNQQNDRKYAESPGKMLSTGSVCRPEFLARNQEQKLG